MMFGNLFRPGFCVGLLTILFVQSISAASLVVLIRELRVVAKTNDFVENVMNIYMADDNDRETIDLLLEELKARIAVLHPIFNGKPLILGIPAVYANIGVSLLFLITVLFKHRELLSYEESSRLRDWHFKLLFLLMDHAPEDVRPGMRALYDLFKKGVDPVYSTWEPDSLTGAQYARRILDSSIEVMYAIDDLGAARIAILEDDETYDL